MPHLQDLTVDWISLVDKAAVRDPQDPSKPRRFLLSKREGVTVPLCKDDGGEGEEELESALEGALDILRPYRADRAEIDELCTQLESESGSNGEALEKAFTGLAAVRTRVAKSELDRVDRIATEERIAKAERQLQHVYMMKSSAGYANAVANCAAEARAREANFGR